jgi:hypothetical protein
VAGLLTIRFPNFLVPIEVFNFHEQLGNSKGLADFFVLFLDEKNQKSRASEKKAKNFPVWLK